MRQADPFYKTTKWRKCRASFIAMRKGIDGGLCEVCGDRIGKIVHHRIHLTRFNMDDPEIALSFKNLQLVCHNCHDVIHGYAGQKKEASRVSFDEMGNVIRK